MQRDTFSVDEPEGPRWNIALELLADGRPVRCMGLGLTLARGILGHPVLPGSALTCALQTRHNSSSLTAEKAEAEIDNAEAGVTEIRERSPEFARLVSGRPIVYELLDDYGMGAVRLAFKDRSGFHFQGLG